MASARDGGGSGFFKLKIPPQYQWYINSRGALPTYRLGTLTINCGRPRSDVVGVRPRGGVILMSALPLEADMRAANSNVS